VEPTLSISGHNRTPKISTTLIGHTGEKVEAHLTGCDVLKTNMSKPNTKLDQMIVIKDTTKAIRSNLIIEMAGTY